MSFNAWPDIEALYNIVKNYTRLLQAGMEPIGPVIYRAKVKLDGTNAAVRVELPIRGLEQAVFYQSRTRDVTPTSDNFGFATWADTLHDDFLAMAVERCQGRVITTYGEWCGQGIQSGTAISSAPRSFVVFAIQVDDKVIVEPAHLRAILGPLLGKGVSVLPWYGEPVTIDLADKTSVERAASRLESDVLAVESCDPWVRDQFGISGIGEGIVLYPFPDCGDRVSRHRLSNLMFKAKGQKHRVKASKVAVQVDPDVLASVEEFAATFVTDQRCLQGLTVACAGDASPHNTGAFMKWIATDVEKESKDDLEASGLTWKQVSQAVMQHARKWYISKSQV